MDDNTDDLPLSPALQAITFDDEALWAELTDPALTRRLREAVTVLLRTVGPPKTFWTTMDVGQWNFTHEPLMVYLDQLATLLLARRLSDTVGGYEWEEPVASLVEGLDDAVAAATETGRLLDAELNWVPPEEDDETPWERVSRAESDGNDTYAGPIGRGRAYLLFRRYIAEIQAALDLLDAVTEEMATAEG